MYIFNIILVFILIALTAFFVASEFAMVKVRRTRITHLVEEGNKKAKAVQDVIMNLDGYLSAVQLGITITALGLGWLGEPTVADLLDPVFIKLNVSEAFAHTLSFAIAFSIITFLHVVLGELAPKTIAIQKAEKVTLLTAKPLIWFYKIMFPFIWALNGSARFFIRLFGIKPANEHEVAHSEEELRLILSESYKKGEINQAEYKYVNNIFKFDERIAKEIMVPRTEMITVDKGKSLKNNINLMLKERFTRFPVMDIDKDHIIGVVNIKDVLTSYISDQSTDDSIETFIRPVIHVIETIPIHDVLLKMQRSQIHMAILVDEYGGTSGLVTVEDILEEIVGEIKDEFDVNEKPIIQEINQGKYIVDGKALIHEVNELLNTNINDGEIDTIGGWVLTKKFDSKVGDIIKLEDYQIKIIVMEGMQIKSLEIELQKGL